MTAQQGSTARTAGLAEVTRPQIVRLADGDRYSLVSGPVRKTLHGDTDAELRMLAYNAGGLGPSCRACRAAAQVGTPTHPGEEPR